VGEGTKIQWTANVLPDGTVVEGYTFNPWIGCEKVSPACKNCYAEVDTFPRVQRRRGLELWGPKAARHITSSESWAKPLAWDRKASREGRRARVFCASLADVFEDRRDLDGARGWLWKLLGQTPNLDWLLLTKRPQNVRRMVPWGASWPTNVWLGTTVEDQEHANERIPHLVECPAAVRFLSIEPMLGPVDLTRIPLSKPVRPDDPIATLNALTGEVAGPGDRTELRVNWCIVGGESGSHARPFHLAHARAVVRQCSRADVPVFVKQLGAVPIPETSTVRNDAIGRQVWMWSSKTTLEERLALDLSDPKGGDPAEWPSDLRIREFPAR
jgi:protein gp37